MNNLFQIKLSITLDIYEQYMYLHNTILHHQGML